MQITKTLSVANRKDWRNWLSKNYKKEKEIWLIFYKKSSGKPSISYNDAVEEALCFGWIDSMEKGIDEEKSAQRFSPRNPKTPYSQTNIDRLKKLIREKKVTNTILKALKTLKTP